MEFSFSDGLASYGCSSGFSGDTIIIMINRIVPTRLILGKYDEEKIICKNA